MLAAIDEQKLLAQWLKDGGAFIPHPKTWLHQGRWQDEPAQVPVVSARNVQQMKAIYEANADVDRAVRNGLALFAASRLGGREIDALVVRASLRGLRDVPADVVLEAADNLCRELGRRFVPNVPEWLGACQAVILARRRALAPKAAALTAECVQCDGSGWERVHDGECERVKRCSCHARAVALFKDLP